jgi:hypothetical protein
LLGCARALTVTVLQWCATATRIWSDVCVVKHSWAVVTKPADLYLLLTSTSRGIWYRSWKTCWRCNCTQEQQAVQQQLNSVFLYVDKGACQHRSPGVGEHQAGRPLGKDSLTPPPPQNHAPWHTHIVSFLMLVEVYAPGAWRPSPTIKLPTKPTPPPHTPAAPPPTHQGYSRCAVLDVGRGVCPRRLAAVAEHQARREPVVSPECVYGDRATHV